MLYLLHTPEVAPQLHDWAVASANRRYGNYWRAVEDLLAGNRREDVEEQRPETAEAAAS